MYYEEQWIEGALCWRTSPDGAWTRYTANELAHRYESAEKRAADAQATVEALQAQLVTLKRHAGLDCGDQSCLYALEHSGMRTNGGCRCSPKRMKDDLERSRKAVEALQRERDEAIREHGKESGFWGRTCARLLDKRDKLQSALDAEREKVKDFEAAAGAMSCKEIADKVAGYTQLKALVRALPVVRIDLNGAYHDTLLARPEDDAVKELLRYRASLDATTPDSNQLGAINDMVSKGGDGE